MQDRERRCSRATPGMGDVAAAPRCRRPAFDASSIPATLRPLVASRRAAQELPGTMGLFNGQDRRPVAVVVTRDGRRVNVPLDELDTDAAPVSVRSILLALLGLLGLIGGSRRESGGPRTKR